METVPRSSEQPLEDGDYCAIDGSVWVRVNNVAIRICGDENGVRIDACLDGDENADELDSMFVPYP